MSSPESASSPGQPPAQSRLTGIFGSDLHNLGLSVRVIVSDDSLWSALCSAHATLDMLPPEASRFQLPPDPHWLALHFLRATEFAWAAAVRSILMLHRAEAMSNIRVALETLGCALIAFRTNATDVLRVTKLIDLLSNTQLVGEQLSKLPETEALKALHKRKKTCSKYGAHGNLYQLAGRLKNERREQSGTAHTLHCDFNYADLDPKQIAQWLSWLVGVAADAAILFKDDICNAAGCIPTPAFVDSLAELARHAQVLAARYRAPAQDAPA